MAKPTAVSTAINAAQSNSTPLLRSTAFTLETPAVMKAEDAGAVAKEEKLPLAEYPIERCAGIAARMAQGKVDRYAILEAEKLKEEPWQALHAHWQAEIKAEARRGEKKMLLAYDQGYVGALEKECGPIGAKEYARLVVAAGWLSMATNWAPWVRA